MILINWRRVATLLVALTSVLVYNEFVVYYLVLLQCTWPQLEVEKADVKIQDTGQPPLKVLLLADTHLLGNREGNWFDKLRREWQMERVFQTAMTIHSPDVVFILGDLFDEGKWCSDVEFQYYKQRFDKMFRHSETTEFYSVAGNHDIGFHYAIDDHVRRRFSNSLSAPSVRKIMIRGNVFVLINSMAMEGDGCNMCKAAEKSLKKIARSLKCSQGVEEKEYCREEDKFPYARPILLQHFPLYRASDVNCTGPDAVSEEERNYKFRQKYDCLSKDATDKLFHWINPRLVVSGHTHNYCHHVHSNGVPEWSVPSFSWRNKKSPSFLLMTVRSNNYSLQKCYMPRENTVIYTYIFSVIIILVWFLFPRNLNNTRVRKAL